MTCSTMPIHPRTGLAALAVSPRGVPVWPILGGAPDGGENGGTPPDGAKPDDKGGADTDGDDKGGADTDGDDKPLGSGGEKALRAERDARKALEQQIAELKASQIDPKKLAEALGIKTDDAKSSADDVVATLQKQVSDMQRDGLVYRIATEHQITDPGDLKFIKAAPDEATMRDLAARLAKQQETEANLGTLGRRTPRQDPSQGKGGGTQQKPGAAGLAEAERRFGSKQ